MSKRLATEELIKRKQNRLAQQRDKFIKNATEIHCGKYDYTNTIYNGCRSYLIVTCPKHGAFKTTATTHLRGCGCPKCAHEAHSNRMKGKGLIYTKEIVFEIAKSCKCRSEFQKLNQQAYHVARINSWLDEMDWFGIPQRHKPIENIRNNIVYIYEFPNKVAYIGRTNNLKKRHKEHKREHKHSNGKISISQVLKYANDNSLLVPQPIILKNDLTLSESRAIEDEMCEKYKRDGYHLLNIAKTGINSGSIGAALLYDNYDEILEKAKTCKSRSEFKRNFGSMYNAARRMKIFESIANECGWRKNCSEKAIIVYTVNNEYVGEFKNARLSSDATNVDYRLISMNCLEKTKQAKGFIFKFK